MKFTIDNYNVGFEEYMKTELEKCRQSPYYFATKYLTVTNKFGRTVPFKTSIPKDVFDKLILSK